MEPCSVNRALRGRLGTAGAALLLLTLVVGVYASSLENAPVWDDVSLVTDNPYLRSLDGLRFLFRTDLWTASAKQEPSNFYRPLAMTTFWLGARLGGQSAAWTRAGNILVHAGNAVLLLLVLRTLLVPSRAGLASLLAAVWALLAVNSEPVFWISGRFDPLSAGFALLCVLANRAGGWRAAAGVALWSAAGLLSKETFMGWLPLLLLDDLLLLRRSVTRVWPKYAVLAGVVGLNILLRNAIGIPSLSVVSETGLRTLSESYLFTFATLLSRVVMPLGLDPFHPYRPLAPGAAAALAAAILATTLLLVARGLRRGASPHSRVALFGWSWLLLGLFPASLAGPNLFMIGDRYAYLPVIGVFICAYAGLDALLVGRERRSERHAWRVAAGALAVIALGQAWAVQLRCPDWRDDRSLAEASLRAHPGNPYALYVLGTLALDEENLAEAERSLVPALRGNPRSWQVANALCVLRLRQGRLDEALAACQRSTALNPRNPRAWSNTASVYVNARQWEPALAAALRSVALKPHYPEGRYVAAVAAANLGNLRLANEHLEAGLRQNPGNARLLELKRRLGLRLATP